MSFPNKAPSAGEEVGTQRRGGPKAVASVVLLVLIVVADLWVWIRNPDDLDRLLINLLLGLSAFATLHLRLLSLASAGFAAIGAYASAIFAVKLGVPIWLAMPAAASVSALVALVIGLPVLRLKDVYLAVATLGFGEIVRVAIILLPDLTGGSTGANLSTGFPYEAMKQTHAWVMALVLLALGWILATTARTRTGRALRAIRENADAAATMGIDVVAHRLLSFAASAFLAGLAGAFYAHSVGSLDAGDFKFTRAVDVLTYAVLGGSGVWFGPLLGAGFLTALPILLRDSLSFLQNFAQLPNIVNGLALMLAIIFMPGGFTSMFEGALGRRGGPKAAGKAGSEAGRARKRWHSAHRFRPTASPRPKPKEMNPFSDLSRSAGILAASRPCRKSDSTCGEAPSADSSDPTEPARPPSSTPSLASSPPARAGYCSPEATSPGALRTGSQGRASRGPIRTSSYSAR